MKTSSLLIRAAAFALCATFASAQTTAPAAGSARPRVARTAKEIKIPALPPFAPQQPTRIRLDNGMVIFLQEDHELPLVEGTFIIRGGERDAPAAKAGLTDILGSAWRTGGTSKKTGDELDDFLEARAAQVETAADLDSSAVSFSALKADLDDVFPVLVDLLRDPAFREDKVDLEKKQLMTGISRRNEDSGGIATREMRKLGYGADSPYARQPEYWTVSAITRQDLVDWHRKFVHPNNVIVGIVGDFDSKQMEARLRQAFASWPTGPAAEKVKVIFKDPKPGFHFIQKDDVNQSNIQMVALGTTRDNPDYYAITVMNEAFGGGFGARLFSNIRSKKGLAYSVGGGIGSNFDHPGLFRLSMGTKSETTAKAIDALYEEIDGLKAHPITAVEVRKAKDSILNSFIFNFDSREKVLREKIGYEFFGYPVDFLEKYRVGIDKVTAEDVNRVVAKYVDRDRFAVLVVGKAVDFDRPLSSFGKVESIDITIRDTPPAAGGKVESAGPSTSNDAGKTLIARIVAAMGGAGKLTAVKAVNMKTATTIKTPQGELELETDDTIAYPDRMRSILQSPMGEIVRVISPDTAYMGMGGRVNDLPAAQKDDAMRSVKRDPLWVAQNADDPRYIFFAAGSEQVAGKTASVLDVVADGLPFRWFVDAGSGLVVRSAFKANSPAGPVQREVDYADYRDVEGVKLSFQRVTRDNGEVSARVTVKTAKINPVVDSKSFEKP